MAVKFYLHNAVTTDTGILPAATATISQTTPSATPNLTNRSMDATIGVLQASTAITTLAAATQNHPIARFCSAPIAAQSIAVQTITLHCGVSESNSNSNFACAFSVALWRPSTGAIVGGFEFVAIGGGTNPAATTSETAITNTNSGGGVTAVDGDILIIEVWRVGTQAMNTAYTNTVFYDGTTDDSATTNAAYLLFTNDIALFVPRAPYNPWPQLAPLLAM